MVTPNDEGVTRSPSKRAQQFFNKAVKSLHTRRNAPPRLPLPINPSPSTLSPTFVMPSPTAPSPTIPSPSPSLEMPLPVPSPEPHVKDWVTVELSNYPPQFTRENVYKLFRNFTIAPDFTIPNVEKLGYPLRAFIKISGQQEAERAVRELCWSLISSRLIIVKMVKKTGDDMAEQPVEDLADEMMNGIVNTARVYYPHLATKFLEVREYVQDLTNFAFLQARDPITVYSEPETHTKKQENVTKWELIGSGRSGGWSWKMKEGSGRLAALKDLQDTIETQGVMRNFWNQCDDRMRLDV